MSKPQIYLDHAAASPIRPAVLKAMQPFFKADFGNPAAITALGVTAKSAIEHSRQRIATVLAAHPDEIIFTSGGTESTNLAIQGILRAESTGHVIATAIEHQAVLEPINLVSHQGYPSTIVPVGSTGLVEVAELIAAIEPATRLISVMLANNEIGTIQPVADLARALRRANRDRAAKNLPQIYLHTDACQAAAYLWLDVNRIGVDGLSLNSAKAGGPKGMGVLYLRRGTPLAPIIVGGGQEAGRRGGTENVAAIVGGALAMTEAQSAWQQESARLKTLRDDLFQTLKNALPDIILNGAADQRLVNNLNLTIPGIDAEALLLYLDADGVTIGTGAACSNLTLEPSHVLKALGLTDQAAHATIRLTLGWTTTKSDVEAASQLLISRVRWLRQ